MATQRRSTGSAPSFCSQPCGTCGSRSIGSGSGGGGGGGSGSDGCVHTDYCLKKTTTDIIRMYQLKRNSCILVYVLCC